MSNTDDCASPYLLRPVGSFEEYVREHSRRTGRGGTPGIVDGDKTQARAEEAVDDVKPRG